jgi:hypothetical protein
MNIYIYIYGFHLVYSVQTEYGVYQASYKRDTRLNFPELKWLVLVAKGPASFSTEITNPWSYTSCHNTSLWPGA